MGPTTATATVHSLPAEQVRVWPLVATSLVLTAVADVLFWEASLGINVGIFAILLAMGVLAARGRRQIGATDWLAFGLIFAAGIQGGIDLGLTNLCVLAALLMVLAGNTYFTELVPVWQRWLRQVVAVATCFERIPWLSATWLAQRPEGRASSPGGRISRALTIVAPAVILLMVFGAIFAGGNLIFNDLLVRFGEWAENWVLGLKFSPWRLVFWLAVASFVLAFLRPRGETRGDTGWILGVWRRPDAKLAWMQSLSALLALNGLFALVNTIDVVDLWSRVTLPEGMSHKDFLHAGVNNLIVATVLAAVVLAVIFQQAPEVTRSRALRWLGHLWIAQNLMLAASVIRRDYLYVEATHLLTEKRVYVLCFLGLVAVGYGFLAMQVQRGGRLARLVWHNTMAAFVLCYGMQFLDVAGFVSGWCARKSIADLSWGFDVTYWSTQGSAAWPAILAVAEAPEGHPNRAQARTSVAELRARERDDTSREWRSWQWLDARNRAQLFEGASQ